MIADTPAQTFEPLAPAIVSQGSLMLARERSMFLSAWYPTIMLALEAGHVIDVRLRTIALGGVAGAYESRLMVQEKLDAGIEAVLILLGGGNSSQVIDNYRKHVAANAVRLGSLNQIGA